MCSLCAWRGSSCCRLTFFCDRTCAGFDIVASTVFADWPYVLSDVNIGCVGVASTDVAANRSLAMKWIVVTPCVYGFALVAHPQQLR